MPGEIQTYVGMMPRTGVPSTGRMSAAGWPGDSASAASAAGFAALDRALGNHCKVAIGPRLKRAGMHWTAQGANAIIALRCCKLSGRFEDFWERRQDRIAA